MKQETLWAGDCIRTFTGIYINVFEPTEDMIDIVDIAHSLSHQCRFGGHLKEFYSVAEHSVDACILAPKERKLEALLHDASEAYLLDIPSPIKKHLRDYKKIEDNLMRVIAAKFGFQYPLSEEVKKIDRKLLEMEWDSMVIKKGFRRDFPLPNVYKHSFLIHFYENYK